MSDTKMALNRDEHPFYRHSTADFFVAEREGATVGRIAAIDNSRHNEYHGSSTGFFYYFDAVDDLNVARALFQRVLAWAENRHLDAIIGPRGLLPGNGHGLLVEGFPHRPAMGIPYNHPYYAALLQGLGFQKKMDFLSARLSGVFDLPERFYDLADRVRKRRGFRVKSFTSRTELRRWVPEVQRINNAGFADGPCFCPIDEAEASVIADRFLATADPRLIKLVLKDDNVVGFVIGYPDVSAGIQRARGRLWPLGWLHVILDRNRTKWLNVNGAALLPEYQGVGAGVVLWTEMAKSVQALRFEHAEFVQVGEDNLKSLGVVDAIGVEWYKRHRIYRLQL